MRDPVHRVTYLEIMSKAFQGPLRAVFWKYVANILDKEIRASIKGIDGSACR